MHCTIGGVKVVGHNLSTEVPSLCVTATVRVLGALLLTYLMRSIKIFKKCFGVSFDMFDTNFGPAQSYVSILEHNRYSVIQNFVERAIRLVLLNTYLASAREKRNCTSHIMSVYWFDSCLFIFHYFSNKIFLIVSNH